MKVRFWGTRGSIPTPGKGTVRYGGNTPCVEVRLQDNGLVIFDAGTGIRALGDALMAAGASVTGHLCITHPHWDHIQGLPFFKPAFISGNAFTIHGPQTRTVSLRRMISAQMDKVYFPVQLSELNARIAFQPLREGQRDIGRAKLSTLYVNHPLVTLGYRLDAGGRSVVYISDNEPFDRELAKSVRNVDRGVVQRYLRVKGDPNQRVADFARGATVFIHDATYTPEEYVHHVGWGHSHYLFALELAARAAVRKLVLFHHAQTHDDDRIDEILARCRREIRTRGYAFECVAAAEGMELEW